MIPENLTPPQARLRYSNLITKKLNLQEKLFAVMAEMRVLDLRTDLWGGAGPDFRSKLLHAA